MVCDLEWMRGRRSTRAIRIAATIAATACGCVAEYDGSRDAYSTDARVSADATDAHVSADVTADVASEGGLGTFVDAGSCRPFEMPLVSGPDSLPECEVDCIDRARANFGCQRGYPCDWDTTAECITPYPVFMSTCARADHCDSPPTCPDAGAGLCPGQWSCTCGFGPACEYGYMCARPAGSTAARSCVCAHPGP